MLLGNTDGARKGIFNFQSRNKVRGLIVVLAFTLLGTGSLLFSGAATNPSVRFVLFCATDKCVFDENLTKLDTIQSRGSTVRGWYRSQLGSDRTLRLLSTKKITGGHSASYYGGGTLSTIQTIANLNNVPALHEDKVKTIVILGFRSMSNCGVTYQGGDLGVIDPFKGCQSYQNSVYAHELGHTFGLGHINDGKLMHWDSCGGTTLSSCSLNSDQRSWLINNRSNWFPVKSTASASSLEPDEVPDDNINPGSNLSTNQQIKPGQYMRSPNGRFVAIHQYDSNFVVYDNYYQPGKPIWYTNTVGRVSSTVILQPDGNLVMYGVNGGAVWHTLSYGRGGTQLAMRDDGNLVIYTPWSTPVWSTLTGLLPLPPSTLEIGQTIELGKYLISSGGKYILAMQPDGNLVLYNSAKQPIWYTNTQGRGGIRLVMQPDGNLVMYSASGQPVWYTNTQGR